MGKKTVVFDFDGVIHTGYNGYKDGSIYGKIDYQLLNFMKDLMKEYYVVISSNRSAEQIVDFLNNDINNPLKCEVFKKNMKDNFYWQKDDVVGVTNEKAIGIIYIDDKGFYYNSKDNTEYNINLISKRLEGLKNG